jgi:nitrilase
MLAPMATTRVALVQAAPVAFDREATLSRFEEWLDRARDAGAELVVFPEAFVGGYPKGADFGARVGSRSEEGRAWFQRYAEGALEVPGETTRALGSMLAERNLHGVVGVIEREGGTLYCTALFFGGEGQLLGKHRKLVPTGTERLIWGRGDGSTITVVDTPLGKIGAAICWESYMPLFRTALYQRGVQLYCAPTVDDRDVWQASMRHIATEGRCFVLACCQYATRADFPPDFPTTFGDDPTSVMIRGGSCVVDPLGNVVAGPLFGEAGLVVTDVDLGAITRGNLDLDVVGHYGRPDVFTLRVHE